MASTAYIALLNHPDIARYSLTKVQKAYSGGAPIPLELVNAFREKTGVTMHPSYGLTETTAPSHSTPLGATPPVDPEYGTLSAGMPLPGTQCRVVDLETGEDVPPGETGEICIKSPTVVPGYWQKPEETAVAIRDGWLHTGDVGSMDENGWFYVVDRVKDLIIVSGYKVWPREVEEALFQHPAVRETAVIGVPDAYRGETVKAYVALKPGGQAGEEELIQFCRERLAAYKVPRIIEFVEEVPKTATGKFSRRTLRETAVVEAQGRS
jgi:long-chain acyl-CoA synthetase